MSVVIYSREGRVVRRSRNLRGLLEHVRLHAVDRVGLSRNRERNAFGGMGGVLRVHFANGDHCTTDFASYDVMREWVTKRRNLRGVSVMHATSRHRRRGRRSRR